MAEIFNFYVRDNRSIQFPKANLLEPIMQEDHNVAVWRFRIPKTLNGIDMSGWAWWFVYVNANGQEFSELLTLVDDIDEPDSFCTADYSIDYGISYHPGNFQFSLEAINTDSGGEVLNEWHTKTYAHKVDKTLQGNQAQWSETESDIISALIVEVRNKVAQLVGGATPEPVSLIANMTDTKKVYLYVGSETGESTNYWYYYNGSAWVAGGLYASGITVDSTPTQGSTNTVSSGGVYSAIHDTDTTLTQPGQAADSKITGNRIDAVVGDVEQISEVVGTETVDDYEYVPVSFSISDTSSTVRSITFEQNTDGTVRVYGTNNSSTSRAIYKLTYNGSDMQLPIQGGETYRFSGRPSTDVDCTIDLRLATGGGVYVDRGGGVTFTPEESNTYYIAIAIGVSASIDAVFSPKLEKLQIVGQKTINVLSAKDTVARDDISGLESVVENFEGISEEVKIALLNCFKNVAWESDDGQNFYDALYDALYNALPSGYTPCDYIVAGLISEEKNANEIITNYHMNSNTRILFKGSMNLSIDASTHNCSLFTDHSADGYGLSIHYETGKEWIDSYRGGVRYRITDAAIGLDTVYDYDLWPDNSIKRNGTIIKSDATDGGKTSGNPMYIFGDFHRGSKLYSFTVYENDKVVANYKPCVRKSDGMVGLYDVVSGEFFGNANLTAMQNS